MHAIDIPVGFKKSAFLQWIAEERSYTEAKWWRQKLSPKAWSKSWALKPVMQLAFNRLYEAFLEEIGEEAFFVQYPKLTREIDGEQQTKELKARQERRIKWNELKGKREYEVVHVEEAHGGRMILPDPVDSETLWLLF
jgi:hypothetical protein